jgi:hypothetical protein
LAAYLRAMILRDAERKSLIDAIRDALPIAPAVANATPSVGTADIAEILQLTRLLASHVNAQAASRISAAINQQYRQRG